MLGFDGGCCIAKNLRFKSTNKSAYRPHPDDTPKDHQNGTIVNMELEHGDSLDDSLSELLESEDSAPEVIIHCGSMYSGGRSASMW